MNDETDQTAPIQDAPCADLDQIAQRAYAIWQEQGCPVGCDMDHWLEAESQFLQCRDQPKAEADHLEGS